MPPHESFKCIATGETYACKESLKHWGFRWNKDDSWWELDYCDETEKSHFERNVRAGEWDGVELEFIKRKKESWEDEIDAMPAAPVEAQTHPQGGSNG